MSASMLGRRICCRPLYSRFASKRMASYVLVPEIPPDTTENNPLLKYTSNPQFSKLCPDKVVTGCAKLAIDYDVGLGKHEENLKDPNFKKDFQSVFEPIEKLVTPLNFAWRTARQLSMVRGADFEPAFERIHRQITAVKDDCFVNEPLYNAVKEVYADKANLTEEQRRLVEMYLLEAKHNGVELQGLKKATFNRFRHMLMHDQYNFRGRVRLCHQNYSDIIEDINVILELPKDLANAMSINRSNPGHGPWKVTLDEGIYEPYLAFCNNRMLRWNAWHGYNNRASMEHNEMNLSNHKTVNELRLHRNDIAGVLGYENFAEMSVASKMAGSVDTVLTFIENLRDTFKPAAENEVEVLQEFANYEGFKGELQMWDIPYWRRRHLESLKLVTAEDVLVYFPLPKVLKTMFDVCGALFDVAIQDCTNEVERWHTDVKYFKVYNKTDGKFQGSFYLDLYDRDGKLDQFWVEPGRENSQLLGVRPFSYVNFSLNLPYGQRPTLLSLDDLHFMSYQFGHALQQVLTTVPYNEVSGQRNVEWDAMHTTAFLLSMIMSNKHILQKMSSHFETGEQLTESRVEDFLAAKKHMSAYDKAGIIYTSALDMEMNISQNGWVEVMEKTWKDYMPMPLEEDDHHPCSLSPIFVEKQGAAYYSFLWAEMMAADMYQVFNEAGFENLENLSQIGRRYRETFLSSGGGVSAGEVFRRFQGRDPSPQGLFQYHELES